MKLLYLDFDGVLHHHQVYLREGKPFCAEGQLFAHVKLLIPVVEAHPDLAIVLSTSWVRALRFSHARPQLPAALQERVIGATWHSNMRGPQFRAALFDSPIMSAGHFLSLPRYAQISMDAQRRGVADWIALDDDDEGWPEEERYRLIWCNPEHGISAPGTIEQLTSKLANLECDCHEASGSRPPKP